MFASLICLKRSVASSTLVGLRSGWYINANFRKAFLIDASSALSGSPRALRCFVLADCAMVSRDAGVWAATLCQFRPRGAGGVRSCPWPVKPLGQPKAVERQPPQASAFRPSEPMACGQAWIGGAAEGRQQGRLRSSTPAAAGASASCAGLGFVDCAS